MLVITNTAELTADQIMSVVVEKSEKYTPYFSDSMLRVTKLVDRNVDVSQIAGDVSAILRWAHRGDPVVADINDTKPEKQELYNSILASLHYVPTEEFGLYIKPTV